MRNPVNDRDTHPHSATSDAPSPPPQVRTSFTLPRWCALIAWLTWASSIALLWGQHRAGTMHPAFLPFVVLLAVTALAALFGTFVGLRRGGFGPSRRAGYYWAALCFLPLGFWAALSIYTFRVAASGSAFPKNIFSDIALTGVASLMEADAQLAYPHRLESERLVMFYDDRVTDPQRDLDAMDRHVAALETLTGKPLRAKIHWVRGEILGRRRMAIRGLVLGSSESPANWDTADHPYRLSVDRHELAHGVIHQLQPPEADPPTLLIESWAEAQSGTTYEKRAEFAKESRDLWRERTGAGPTQSYLRDLTGPEWYRRIDGPVYNVGGAFAEFVLRKFGVQRFLNLYFACRPGRFDEECLAQLGIELDTLERDFWAEVDRLAGKADHDKQH